MEVQGSDEVKQPQISRSSPDMLQRGGALGSFYDWCEIKVRNAMDVASSLVLFVTTIAVIVLS